ncbi:unnamed protein product, partial [Amoebophrya sp. A120]|eukprot:GSA120T00001938001.1
MGMRSCPVWRPHWHLVVACPWCIALRRSLPRSSEPHAKRPPPT